MDRLQELVGPDVGAMLLALVTAAVLLAVVLTWPVCSLLLWRYRRAVRAGMRRRSTPRPAAPPRQRPQAGAVPGVRIELVELPTDATGRLADAARTNARHARVVFVVAGLLYGLGSTAAYLWVGDLAWTPVRTVSLVLLLGWLVVPTAISLGITDRRVQAALWGAYLLLLLVLPVLGGTSLRESAGLLLVVVLVPGLFVVATGLRTLRGAAWLVAPALTALGLCLGVLLIPGAYLLVGVPFDGLAWTLVALAGGVVLAVAGYAWAMGRLYVRKVLSDELLLVLQWWFVLTLVQALLLGTQGLLAALAAVSPLGLMVGVLLLARLVRRGATTTPARLLLLRTFGARRRSSRLLRDLTVHWRWVGSVELVTAPDLATEVLEPHDLLDFLGGRLARRFVRDEEDLRRRVHELDLRPDLDGRYRVNDMLCHDDTWRAAVDATAQQADAVLVDLRGLDAGRTGVVHELERLVALVPLPRVVALTDATTDQRVLREALDRAAVLAPAGSPLLRGAGSHLWTLTLAGRRVEDVQRVLAAVAAAAGEPAQRGRERASSSRLASRRSAPRSMSR